MLVCWSLDAVSMSHVLQSMVVLGADVFNFGAQDVSFGILVASTLTHSGTIEQSRGTSEHKKVDFRVQAWISVDFEWISGPDFESFW